LKPIDYTPTYQIPLRFCLFVDIYYPGIWWIILILV
jgi:hypothetical protein